MAVALLATGATIAVNTIGGGDRAGLSLSCIEQVASKGDELSCYGRMATGEKALIRPHDHLPRWRLMRRGGGVLPLRGGPRVGYDRVIDVYLTEPRGRKVAS
mgnify:CR=1 FL=1